MQIQDWLILSLAAATIILILFKKPRQLLLRLLTKNSDSGVTEDSDIDTRSDIDNDETFLPRIQRKRR